jgi:hypothetical protein
MAGTQTKWWLPSAVAAAAGLLEVLAALYVKSPLWIAFGIVWMFIAAVYYFRARL